MRPKRLKLVSIAAFAAFAVLVALFRSDPTLAQKDKAGILALSAGYKTWKQPTPPPKVKHLESTTVVLESATIAVVSSTEFG